MTDKQRRLAGRERRSSHRSSVLIAGTEKIPIKFVDIDEIVPTPCNQVMVQHVGDQFVLAFNYMLVPMTENIQSVRSVKCLTRAKVTMSADKMESFLAAANKNFQAWKNAAAKKASLGASEDVPQEDEEREDG